MTFTALRCRVIVAGVLFAAAGLTAAAGADQSATTLDRYLEGLTSLHTEFKQTVTDARGKQSEAGSGTLLVQRPGKFRWDYSPHGGGKTESGQLLVADGKNLWFYDRELAQVTVKPVAAALSATPVMLLSGSAAQLHDTFEIASSGTHDGMDWVHVKPRSEEADFNGADLGFKRDQLVRMTINDRLGQTVQMDFSRSERNGRVDSNDLQFKPPAGVDVIGTPQS